MYIRIYTYICYNANLNSVMLNQFIIQSITTLVIAVLAACRGASIPIPAVPVISAVPTVPTIPAIPAIPAVPTIPTVSALLVNNLVADTTDYDPHPQYSYGYDVQDPLTGDTKSQYESRNGNIVSGSYSLIEADGSKRIVEYTADPVNGFNAVIHREPVTIAKPIVKIAMPVVLST